MRNKGSSKIKTIINKVLETMKMNKFIYDNSPRYIFKKRILNYTSLD